MIPFGNVLDARKERATLPANPIYSTPPLTVECLAKLDSAAGFNILVANEPKSSATHWELYTYAGSGVLAAYLPGYAPAEVKSDAVVTDGKWHYCAMTFDGRVVRLYMDGEPVRSEPVLRRSGMAAVDGPLGVGDVPGQGIGCDGVLDEVRVSSVIRPIKGTPEAPFDDDADTLALWHFDPVWAGTGESSLADPFRAGAEAALRARKALGGDASAVIVFDSLAGDAAAREKMLEGIGWFFDTAVVYGCSGFGPITRAGNTGTVGIVALGQAVTCASACAEVAGDHGACGARLGEALRIAAASAGPGRLALLLGDCHVPANDALVGGFLQGLGIPVLVAGGSCPQNGFVYDRGAVKQGVNVALLLTGDFTAQAALGAAESPDRTASSAREIVARAASAGANPVLAFVFNCVSRRQALGDAVETELDAMRAPLGGAPMIGFYGSGEIGADSATAASRGVGGHLAVVTIHPRR